jgi:hypothetical protein
MLRLLALWGRMHLSDSTNTLLSPAPHLTPKQTSRRVVVLAVQLTALVLMAAYSATLVSFLAVSRTSPPFRTLRELLEDGSYQLGLIAKSAEYDYFAVSPTTGHGPGAGLGQHFNAYFKATFVKDSYNLSNVNAGTKTRKLPKEKLLRMHSTR